MNRDILAIGNTGTQLVNKFNDNFKKCQLGGNWFNVEDYGAVHNGSTDDTVAIQAAINAVFAAGGGVLYFPIGIYVIGGALQTNVGGINYNSQLYIPQVNFTVQTRCSITIRGEVNPNYLQTAGIGLAVTPNTGVILKSTLVSGTALSYVIATKGAAANFQEKNYTDCNIESLQIQLTVNGDSAITLGGIGFRKAGNVIIKNVSIFPYNLNLVNSGTPINNCIGICMPEINCEHMSYVENCNVGGFETGYKLGDHTFLNNVTANCCKYSYDFGANYQLAIGIGLKSFWSINDIYITGACYLKIHSLQVEWDNEAKWYASSKTVLDASNYGHGEIHYNITEADVGFNNAKFSKSGGANLQCIPIAFAAAASFTVTGAKAGNAALTSLISKLTAKGIIIDSTT